MCKSQEHGAGIVDVCHTGVVASYVSLGFGGPCFRIPRSRAHCHASPFACTKRAALVCLAILAAIEWNLPLELPTLDPGRLELDMLAVLQAGEARVEGIESRTDRAPTRGDTARALRNRPASSLAQMCFSKAGSQRNQGMPGIFTVALDGCWETMSCWWMLRAVTEVLHWPFSRAVASSGPSWADIYQPRGYSNLRAAWAPDAKIEHRHVDLRTAGWLRTLMEEAGVEAAQTVVTACHSCGVLADELIHECLQAEVSFAVVPCCHGEKAGILPEIGGFVIALPCSD